MIMQLWPQLLSVLPGFAGGMLLGLIYFRAVQASVDMILSGKRTVLAVVFTLGRFLLMGLGLVLALQVGAAALLAMLAGVLAARTLVIRYLDRERA